MIQNDFRSGLKVKLFSNLKSVGLSVFVFLFLSASLSAVETRVNVPKSVSFETDIDYLGMANNFLTGFFGTSPKILSIHLEKRNRKQIGKSIWKGQFKEAISQALQYATDKAIGTVPALAQLNAMAQLGKDLGDLAWITYGPGEFDKIYSKYFKDFTKNDLSQPPDDFIKAMIEEGSATVLFGWLDQRAGKTYTSDQKVTIIWEMIRKRRSFEILCKKHHLKKNACTNEKLIKLEQVEAEIIAEVARELEQDSRASDDFVQAFFDGRKSFDRSYVSGLSWSISLRKVSPFESLRGSVDIGVWNSANIRRYRKARKSSFQMARYFVTVTIRIKNNSGADLKGFYLMLKAQSVENDCLTHSGTVSGMVFTDSINPSKPVGGMAPSEVFDRLYRPIDEADMEAQKYNLPLWYRSAVSEKRDIPRGESRTFTVLLGASSKEKLKYSRLEGYFYGGTKHRQRFGAFLRRPLNEPMKAPYWSLKTQTCPKQKEYVKPFDRKCNLFSSESGIILTDKEVSAMKALCAKQNNTNGWARLESSGLQIVCKNGIVDSWWSLSRRASRKISLKNARCSSINKRILWRIDVGKSKTSTKTMFRIHVTNNSGIDLPRFQLTVECAQDNYLSSYVIDKEVIQHYRNGGKKYENEHTLYRPKGLILNKGYCSLQKLRFYCDDSPWRSGLKAGETKTYKVIYNGCGGVWGKLGFNGTVYGQGISFADGSKPPSYMYHLPSHYGDIGYFLRYQATDVAPKVWKRQPFPQTGQKKNK